MSHRCRDGSCCGEFRGALTPPPPSGVRLVSVWSPTDGAVDPAACRDPHADCHEVNTSHVGMAFARHTWELVAQTLRHDDGNEDGEFK